MIKAIDILNSVEECAVHIRQQPQAFGFQPPAANIDGHLVRQLAIARNLGKHRRYPGITTLAISVIFARFRTDMASVITLVYIYGRLLPSITVRLTVAV